MPEIYKKVNVDVLKNICDRLLIVNPTVTVLAISTGAVYEAAQALPLTENSTLVKDGSPYTF